MPLTPRGPIETEGSPGKEFAPGGERDVQEYKDANLRVKRQAARFRVRLGPVDHDRLAVGRLHVLDQVDGRRRGGTELRRRVHLQLGQELAAEEKAAACETARDAAAALRERGAAVAACVRRQSPADAGVPDAARLAWGAGRSAPDAGPGRLSGCR